MHAGRHPMVLSDIEEVGERSRRPKDFGVSIFGPPSTTFYSRIIVCVVEMYMKSPAVRWTRTIGSADTLATGDTNDILSFHFCVKPVSMRKISSNSIHESSPSHGL